MSSCAVYGCNNSYKNTKGKGIRFYSFPKNEYRQAWINACKRADPINTNNARICSIHFQDDAREKPLMQLMLGYSPKHCKKLKPDAVPTEMLPNTIAVSPEIASSNLLRNNRASKRESHTVAADLCAAAANDPEMDCSLNAPSILTSPLIPSNSAVMTIDTPHSSVTEDADTVMNTPQAADFTCHTVNSTPHSANYSRLDALFENHKLQQELTEANTKIQSSEKTVTQLTGYIKQLEQEVEYYKTIKSYSPKDPNSLLKAKLHELLKGVFTCGQINFLFSKKKKVKQWSKEDLADAISLRSISPQAYRYLREKKNHPYPGLSTLRTFAAKFQLKQGLQEDVLILMKSKGLSMTSFERIAALSIDEMYISALISFDKGQERIIGPHRRVQVVMARGLTSNWKQVVFYDFDFDMSQNALMQVISSLHSSAYEVVSLTSDMGSTNVGLWKQLQISYTNCSFSHPSTNEPVFVFADPPHLLKAARNHFLDDGFVVNNEYVGRGILDSLVSIDKGDTKVAYKISQAHLNVTGSERQKVKLACQLLSNTTAAAVEFCCTQGLLTHRNWKQTVDMLRLFNDWFDVHNSFVPFDKYEGRNGYGTNLERQNKILTDMDNYITVMRAHKKKSLLPFQKGILLSNQSLRNLYMHLKTKYDLRYVLTRRLNQDVLENFFSTIRGMGGYNDHPSPLSFMHRLRWYVLGKHSGLILSDNKNTEEDHSTGLVSLEDDSVLMSSDIINKSEALPGDLEEVDKEDDLITLESPSGKMIDLFASEEELNLLKEMELQVAAEEYSGDRMEEEALRNIAGYVAYRFSKDCPHLSNGFVSREEKANSENLDWLSFLSRGHLTRPSDLLMNVAKVVELDFQAYHGSGVNHKCGVFRDMVERVREKVPLELVSEDVLRCLIRTRTYIRIRMLNKDIQERLRRKKNTQKKRKFQN